jgi:hypothetical protein
MNIVEGEWNYINTIIAIFWLAFIIFGTMKLYYAWPTLALKATEICIGGGCP